MNNFFSDTLMIIALLLTACSSSGGKAIISSENGSEVPLKYASNLSITDYPDYSLVTIRNPWDTTRILHSYVLVPRDIEMPEGLPQGTVVRTPLQRSVVYSAVHNALICELGAIDAITGVCEPEYIHQKDLAQRIADGAVANCGSSMSPNLEKIFSLKPGAILLSPYESNNLDKLSQIGIPIVECADYMENSPLARAEWMKLYGRLYGQAKRADSLFTATEQEYLNLKALTTGISERPLVLFDLIWSQAWSQPCANSTMGIFVWDAGGKNIAQDIARSGSVTFTPEEVLFRAKDADLWLMRYAQTIPMTKQQLAKDFEIYTRFKPYCNNKLYGCNTQEVLFYEETPYHPQYLLANLISILHPELTDSLPTPLRSYFTPLN